MNKAIKLKETKLKETDAETWIVSPTFSLLVCYSGIMKVMDVAVAGK